MARTRLPGHWLTLAILLLGISVQPAQAQLRDARQASPVTTAADIPTPPTDVDFNSYDPHDWRALAVRLPAGQAPRMDGKLDDDVWRLAPAYGNFIQRDPDVGDPSTHKTEFKVLYDDSRIYVAIWAWEPHENGVIASELERDALLRKGDAVRVTFDTFHDHRNLFYFSTNPLGVFKDGYVTDNRSMNWDWNAVWNVKATSDDRGWYSEFEIPLSQMRFKDAGDQEEVWGFNVVRLILHNREESSFVPMPREWGNAANFRPSGSGLLVGLSGLHPHRRFEVIPFVAPGVVRNFDAGTPTDWTEGYGADIRLGLTQTLNADLTIKTDFAQVEADQEVVNLTRFNLSFPEKRQFFTEGAGFFNYGGGGGGGGGSGGALPLFYSRSIGLSADGRGIPIIAGGRVTGNPGAYSVGLLNVQTDETQYAVGNSLVNVPRANYTVARLKRNVLNSSSIGLIALNREGAVNGHDYNRSIGFDGQFTLTRNLTVVSLLAKTFTPQVDARDMAGAIDLDWTGDKLGLSAGYSDIQEAFNAEMGFIRRTDIRNSNLGANLTLRPRFANIRQLTLGSSMEFLDDHQGTLQSRSRGANMNIMRNDNSNARFSFSNDYDLLDRPFKVGPNTVAARGYEQNTFSGSFATNDGVRVYGGAGADIGQYYGGDKQTVRTNLNVLARETLLIENTFAHNRIKLPSAPLYLTNTLSTRVTYSLSPTLFTKAFVQYNDDRRVASANLLLWWVYRPGSDLYVVYNQGWETDIPGPEALRVRSRSVAVKFTYWLSR